jgi:hypothetical protein
LCPIAFRASRGSADVHGFVIALPRLELAWTGNHAGIVELGEADARRRLRDVRAQLDFAELATTDSTAEAKKAVPSCAVLAGIAAADAACCKSLGRRSRCQDHRDAVVLVRQVAPGGSDAARQLERLLGLKDQAEYGFEDIARSEGLDRAASGASADGLRRARARSLGRGQPRPGGRR